MAVSGRDFTLNTDLQPDVVYIFKAYNFHPDDYPKKRNVYNAGVYRGAFRIPMQATGPLRAVRPPFSVPTRKAMTWNRYNPHSLN